MSVADPAERARRQARWARIHIAGDRREPFFHQPARRPDKVVGCACGKAL